MADTNLTEQQLELLSAWLDGETTEAEAAAATALLEQSEAARAYLAEMRRVRELVAQGAAVDAPAGLAERVLASVRQPAPAGKVYAMSWRSSALAAAAALLLALGVMFGPMLFEGGVDTGSGEIAQESLAPLLDATPEILPAQDDAADTMDADVWGGDESGSTRDMRAAPPSANEALRQSTEAERHERHRRYDGQAEPERDAESGSPPPPLGLGGAAGGGAQPSEEAGTPARRARGGAPEPPPEADPASEGADAPRAGRMQPRAAAPQRRAAATGERQTDEQADEQADEKPLADTAEEARAQPLAYTVTLRTTRPAAAQAELLWVANLYGRAELIVPEGETGRIEVEVAESELGKLATALERSTRTHGLGRLELPEGLSTDPDADTTGPTGLPQPAEAAQDTPKAKVTIHFKD
jgi:hypothetical protein